MSSNLSRGSQEAINKTPIQNGKIRFAVDTARLFFDTVYQRIEITDFIKGLKYSEILALEFPLPKVYLSSDTNQLLFYDFIKEEWIILSLPLEQIVTDISYYKDKEDPNAKEKLSVKYGNGEIKLIESERIIELENRVKILEETVAKYVETIEILERQIQNIGNPEQENTDTVDKEETVNGETTNNGNQTEENVEQPVESVESEEVVTNETTDNQTEENVEQPVESVESEEVVSDDEVVEENTEEQPPEENNK